MKKNTIITLAIIGGILLVLLILLGWFVGAYNGLVTSRENVNTQFSNLDASYQRRADLIPNLVQTVAGIAQQERTVFEQVTTARAQVGKITLSATDLNDPAKVQAYKDAQNALGSSLSRLIAVAENYPQIKSSENFLALQSQLEGTENRINVARRDYNDAARVYNVMVQRFPTNFVASMFNFDVRGYFEAQPGAETVPVVDKGQFA